jgi:hypothetical protein
MIGAVATRRNHSLQASHPALAPGPLAEPVHESAPLARWIAERLCRVAPGTGESCAWYHGFRQYLRALDLAITPADHADFLLEAFRAAVTPGHRVSVLVSGSIDYSMFAHVLWACRNCGVSADVTVVDVCDTPLFLNLWYARRIGTPVRTVRSSILEYQNPDGYDFICTNAFFGQFSPGQRADLMIRWHDLLAPGGRVITVTPFRPGHGAEPIGFATEEALALRDAVRQRAHEQAGRLDLDPEDLAQRADAFAARMRVHPLRSLPEIRSLFENGGFHLEHLSSSPLPGPPSGDGPAPLTGPTVSRSAEYAQIVGRRN